jgi:hypothetical protein
MEKLWRVGMVVTQTLVVIYEGGAKRNVSED